MADIDFRRPRRKRGAGALPTESPFPVPIQSITQKESCDSRWYYYFAHFRENSVVIERLGDLTFLYKMGFFGKGNLSRSKPEFNVVSDISQKAFSTSEKLRRLPPRERRIRQSKFRQIRKERYQRHLEWSRQVWNSDSTSAQTDEIKTYTKETDGASLRPDDGKTEGNSLDDESSLSDSCSSSDPEICEDVTIAEDNTGENAQNTKNTSEFSHPSKRRKEDPYKVYEHLQLSLEEAFFLSYGLGCLTVYDAEQMPMTLHEMWQKFCSVKRNFVATYIAYHYFRAKGWVPKVGIKYGSDLVLYKQGMPFYHSSYSIVVQMVDSLALEPVTSSNMCDRNRFSWQVLCGLGRVNEHAAKEVMLCYIIKPEELTGDDLETPSCIPHFKVQEVIMRRWIPEKARDHETEFKHHT